MRWLIGWLVLVALFGLFGAARAQAPTVPAPPSVYTLVLTNDQVNLLGKALGKLPFEDVYQIITVIQSQVNTQQADATRPHPTLPEQPK